MLGTFMFEVLKKTEDFTRNVEFFMEKGCNFTIKECKQYPALLTVYQLTNELRDLLFDIIYLNDAGEWDVKKSRFKHKIHAPGLPY